MERGFRIPTVFLAAGPDTRPQAINLGAANTLNPTGFAAVDANGYIVPAPASIYTDVAAAAVIADNAATNLRMVTGGTGTTLTLANSGVTTLNSILMTDVGGTRTVNIAAGQTLRLGVGGVLNVSDAVATRQSIVIGQTFKPRGPLQRRIRRGELFLMATGLNATANTSVTVSSGIKDNGATPTKVVTGGYVVPERRHGATPTRAELGSPRGVFRAQFNAFGTGDVHIAAGAQTLLNQAGTWNNNFFISGFGSGESGGIGAIRINSTTPANGLPDRILTGTITLEAHGRHGQRADHGKNHRPGRSRCRDEHSCHRQRRPGRRWSYARTTTWATR